jgi:hypothetical protein
MSEVSDLIEEKLGKEVQAEHKLVYDSSSETLEPIYFFILDLAENFGFNLEKFTDSFTSSPGSGHFGELGQRATVMQQQASKMMGDINTVLRSVLNILYDLKEFKIRLASYDDLKSKDEGKRDRAILSLKQIWMDKVDIQKGNSAIKAMALGQAGFVPLIDAFLASKDSRQAEKIDLNERVKRILIPRLNEFEHWIKSSEEELRKRYEIERNYLGSQVNSLKLYSKWVKPYLLAARDLSQGDKRRDPSLVKTFNTIMLDLVLFGKREYKLDSDIAEGNLPEFIGEEKVLRKLRKFSTCLLIEFKFRGIPQRVSQGQAAHYAFGGKAEISFKGYALNEEEIKKLNQLVDEKDLEDSLALIEGATDAPLKAIQKEIEEFLDEKEEKEKKEEKSGDESNPLLAILGFYNKKKKKEEKKEDTKIEKIKKDTYNEKMVRSLVEEDAAVTAFTIFDTYKKAHGMASFN